MFVQGITVTLTIHPSQIVYDGLVSLTLANSKNKFPGSFASLHVVIVVKFFINIILFYEYSGKFGFGAEKT